MDAAQLWEQVRTFAAARLEDGQPIFTMDHRIRNYITDVTEGSIGRRSDDGISNVSRVTKGMVANLWNELNGLKGGQYLYFTKALVLAAAPDLVEVFDGVLRLRKPAHRTYLLTWNPATWAWKALEQDLANCASGQMREDRWSTGNTKRIVPGDRLFLLKQGDPPRGIMGSGWARSSVEEQPHYDPGRASRGEKGLFVRVQFERLVAPEAVLSIEKLKNGLLRNVYWHPPASGTELPPEAAEELERQWAGFAPRRTKDALPDELTPGAFYVEGAVRTAVVNQYERDPAARRACVAAWGVRCSVCEFSFSDVYGELGEGFIHVHHLKPLASQVGEHHVDPVRDLRPVCPNCHAMLHRQDPPLTIEELQKRLRAPQ